MSSKLQNSKKTGRPRSGARTNSNRIVTAIFSFLLTFRVVKFLSRRFTFFLFETVTPERGLPYFKHNLHLDQYIYKNEIPNFGLFITPWSNQK
ncbi:hypothetical protein BpHYR1_022809 [Brachionus plicatilis]|uniref:Uncharacterized protein n=1 Tax=Brachionus plicatilis TaxID=10195 RepID=A0A3M7SYL7_BRAPC|nr:hypothetical protein BpHYR1_022809 [Brachionus plicatilis]